MNKREKEVLQAQLDKEKAVLEELKKQYSRSLRDIEQKTKVLMFDIQQLDEALNTDGLDDRSKEVLESRKQSKIYQKQHQDALKKQIEAITEKLHSDEYSTIEQYLKECYTDAYVGTMYDIAGQGIPVITPIDQTAVVRAVTLDSKISTKENSAVGKLYAALGVDKLKTAISAEISRGIATGLPYAQIAKNLDNVTKAKYSNTMRIVRTEGHRIQNASAYDAQQAAKAKGCNVVKQWDSTLDGSTRPTHRALDGQIREVEEHFEVAGKSAKYPGDFGDPAEDCNCRCAVLTRARWALGESELKTLQDRARFFGLDKSESFEDYKEKYLKAAKETAKAETSVRKFVPAKNIEEAEEYALKFVSSYQSKWSGNVSFKGLSVESANTINQTLDELYDKYNLPKLRNIKPMNFRENIWKDCKDTPMAYRNMGDGDLYFNPKILKDKKSVAAYFTEGERAYKICVENIDKFSGSKRELIETYIKAGRSLVSHDAKDKLAGILQHEMGHHIQNQIIYHDKTAVQIVNDGFEKYSVKISGYATKTKGEYIAESFCAFMNGEADRVDPALKTYFEGLTKQ